jgi:hypothetical protein
MKSPEGSQLAEMLWTAEVSSGDLIYLCNIWPDKRLAVLVF